MMKHIKLMTKNMQKRRRPRKKKPRDNPFMALELPP